MPITDIEDVRDQLPQVELSSQSRPTEQSVLEWIEEAEATLMATLSNLPVKGLSWSGAAECRPRFTTPIDPDDSPISASIVRDMVVHAVAARILHAALFGVGDVSTSGAREAQQYYDSRVQWLMDPKHPFTLPDAVSETPDPSECASRSWFTGIRGRMGGGYRPMPSMRMRF